MSHAERKLTPIAAKVLTASGLLLVVFLPIALLVVAPIGEADNEVRPPPRRARGACELCCRRAGPRRRAPRRGRARRPAGLHGRAARRVRGRCAARGPAAPAAHAPVAPCPSSPRRRRARARARAAPAPAQLPFMLALACILVLGWLFGRSFDFFFGLPPLLGYMCFGFIFRGIQGGALQAARRYLVNIAFILVLVRAGLEISPKEISSAFTLTFSFLPFAFDMFVTGIVASSMYGLSGLEATAFSAVMCSIGDGIIIPRMADLIRRVSPGHQQLPRAVLTAAPVESVTALFVFGVCSSMLVSQPAPGEAATGASGAGGQFGLLVLQIVITILMAAAVAHAFALLLGARKHILWNKSGRQLFLRSAHEELILVMAMALLAYGVAFITPVPESLLGRRAEAKAGGFTPSLIQADLCVMICLFIFKRLRPVQAMHRVEEGISGLWTVGAIFLFVSLGSNLNLPAQTSLLPANPLELLIPVVAGLAARTVIQIGFMAVTSTYRGVPFTLQNLAYEIGFMICACLPRATTQSVLGSLALQNALTSPEVGQLFAATSTMTILAFAPVGVVMQSLICERCLAKTIMPSGSSAADDASAEAHDEAAARARPTTGLGRALETLRSYIFEPNDLTTGDANDAHHGRGGGGGGDDDDDSRDAPPPKQQAGGGGRGAHGLGAAAGVGALDSELEAKTQAHRPGPLPPISGGGGGGAPLAAHGGFKGGAGELGGIVHIDGYAAVETRESGLADAAADSEDEARAHDPNQPEDLRETLVAPSGRRLATAAGGAVERRISRVLTAEEDAELRRISSLYTHGGVHTAAIPPTRPPA
jgi:hypothetical protein